MANINDSKNWGFETRQLHIGQEQADPVTDARAVPIYATTSYVFHDSQHAADRFGLRDAGNIYGRLTNPTQDIFEQRIASLEGGVAALAVASGAAAITYTFQALAKAGEHIVASTPPIAVPCPPINFVAEWTTISAPYSIGRIRYGVANVESTTSGI